MKITTKYCKASLRSNNKRYLVVLMGLNPCDQSKLRLFGRTLKQIDQTLEKKKSLPSIDAYKVQTFKGDNLLYTNILYNSYTKPIQRRKNCNNINLQLPCKYSFHNTPTRHERIRKHRLNKAVGVAIPCLHI